MHVLTSDIGGVATATPIFFDGVSVSFFPVDCRTPQGLTRLRHGLLWFMKKTLVPSAVQNILDAEKGLGLILPLTPSLSRREREHQYSSGFKVSTLSLRERDGVGGNKTEDLGARVNNGSGIPTERFVYQESPATSSGFNRIFQGFWPYPFITPFPGQHWLLPNIRDFLDQTATKSGHIAIA